jgi:hypothetical protein
MASVLAFMPIRPGGGAGPLIQFPAYIKSINNNFSGNWNDHQDMGHGDPKIMYGSHGQDITIEFMVAALDPGNHELLVKAINSLSDLTKPIYQDGKGFNGMLARVYIEKYIQGIYGAITSVAVSVNNSSTPWGQGLPFYMDVTVTMKVVSNSKGKRPWYRNGSNATFADSTYSTGTN